MRELIFLALKHKTIAIVAAAVLSVGGAVAFASQDAVFLGPDGGTQQVVGADEPTPTPDVANPTATPVDDSTPTPTPEADQPTPTSTADAGGDATATPSADNSGDATPGPRDVVGIPDSNPVKQPENGDGVCQKGETVVKTTPSGRQVNVPCNAVDKTNGSKAPTPEATSDTGNTNSNNGKNKGGG